MASTALLEPEFAGVKVRDRAHSAFGSRLVQVLPARPNCPSPPATAAAEITSVVSPVFFTVTVCGVPIVPTRRLVKLTVAGVTLITGAMPLPESATIEGLPAASLAMLKLALLAPRLVGLKVRVIVQLPPTGTVVQPLLPIAY
jgi:hypothetical protein